MLFADGYGYRRPPPSARRSLKAALPETLSNAPSPQSGPAPLFSAMMVALGVVTGLPSALRRRGRFGAASARSAPDDSRRRARALAVLQIALALTLLVCALAARAEHGAPSTIRLRLRRGVLTFRSRRHARNAPELLSTLAARCRRCPKCVPPHRAGAARSRWQNDIIRKRDR
jgi:hypothetical protein